MTRRIRPRSAGAHYVPPRAPRDPWEVVEIVLFPILLLAIIVAVVVLGSPPPTPTP